VLNALEPWHLIIIGGVLVVLFGAKRLPNSARSLGRSMRIFRAEMAHDRDTEEIPPIPQATPLPPVPTAAVTDVAAGGRP
jgi:sec-independent protein translocase protein TatA